MITSTYVNGYILYLQMPRSRCKTTCQDKDQDQGQTFINQDHDPQTVVLNGRKTKTWS